MHLHAAQPRAVALVFDDSTSMNGKPFQAVNYAMQTMIGLLNPNDQLYVVRMTAPEQAQLIDLRSKQTEMLEVRKWNMCKQTLFQAVQTAMETLQKSNSKDKWMIIFTDGEMNISQQEIQTAQKFLAESGSKVILLNINVKENNLTKLFTHTGHVDIIETPADFNKITEHMEQIAISVMGMTESGLAVNAGKNYITIDSLMPLKRVVVLEQGPRLEKDLNNIANATDNAGKEIKVAGSFLAAVPNVLNGKITHLTYDDDPSQVIPKGRITIKFDRNIKEARFKCLPEVAASLSAAPTGGYHHSEGNVYFICEDVTQLEIKAELKTHDGQPLPQSILEKTEVKLHFGNEIKAMKAGVTGFTETIDIPANDLPVSVSAKYPGYFNFRTNVFTIRRFQCPQLGIKEPSVYTWKVTDLENAPYITLYPLINDVKATEEQFKYLTLKNLEDPELEFDVIRETDCWKVRPKLTKGLVLLTPTGKFEIKFGLESSKKDIKSSSHTIHFNILDASLWEKYGVLVIGLLILILLIWYLLGLIKKSRFAKGSEIIYFRTTQSFANKPRTYPLRGSFFNRFIVPYKPERAQVYGMTFVAGKRSSYIIIPPSSQTDNMRISGNKVEDPGRRELRFSKNEELVVQSRTHKENYEYSVISSK